MKSHNTTHWTLTGNYLSLFSNTIFTNQNLNKQTHITNFGRRNLNKKSPCSLCPTNNNQKYTLIKTSRSASTQNKKRKRTRAQELTKNTCKTTRIQNNPPSKSTINSLWTKANHKTNCKEGPKRMRRPLRTKKSWRFRKNWPKTSLDPSPESFPKERQRVIRDLYSIVRHVLSYVVPGQNP